jgi:hypothetical protein
MASLAGGSTTGVAPKANLYLVKVKGQYRHTGTSAGVSTSFHNKASIEYWSQHVQSHIESRKASRKNGDPEIRSVVNMSSGKQPRSVFHDTN